MADLVTLMTIDMPEGDDRLHFALDLYRCTALSMRDASPELMLVLYS